MIMNPLLTAVIIGNNGNVNWSVIMGNNKLIAEVTIRNNRSNNR